MALRIALALTLLVVIGRTAVADDTPAARPHGYLGVTAGALYGIELGVDGGWRIPRQGLLWVHGRGFLGAPWPGDRTEEGYAGGAVGIELRTPGTHSRFVVGVDLGAMHVEEHNEDELVRSEWELHPSWHIGGEEAFGPVAFRYGLASMAIAPRYPLVTFGLTVMF